MYCKHILQTSVAVLPHLHEYGGFRNEAVSAHALLAAGVAQDLLYFDPVRK
jgi:hypothetical protein